MKKAGKNVMAVCFHNGNPTPERAWDRMERQYPNVLFYKVNTIKSEDIRDKYADGASKPYFKFYIEGELQNEVTYKNKWEENELVVRKALSIHNKDPEYDPNHTVAQIKSLDDFEKVVKGAGRLAVGICFHDAS